MSLKAPAHILNIAPYVPGKPLEELAREYGIRDAVKLASNENPLGPSPAAMAAVQAAMANLHRYPEGSAPELTARLADRLGVPPASIVIGAGSDEVIGMLTRVFLGPGDEVILPRPAFLMYEIMTRCDGATPVPVPLTAMAIDLAAMARRVTPRTRMIFLTNPNNPTGGILKQRDFEAFLEAVPPDVIVVLDEAYIEFARDPEGVRGIDYLRERLSDDSDDARPIVTLRTFSKAYGLAGIRVGYGVMPPRMAGLLHRVRQPFNVSSLGQAAALAALDDDRFLQDTLRTVHEGIDYLSAQMDRMGLSHHPTEANFIFIRMPRSADSVFQDLLREGVIIRSMTAYGFPDHIRVTAGTPAENERFVGALARALGKEQPA